MSKSIASYSQEERRHVVTRRLAGNTRGAGYWAARDAAAKLKIGIPEPKPHTPRRAPKRLQGDDDAAPVRKHRHQKEAGYKPFNKLNYG